jgi:hypothetical protein
MLLMTSGAALAVTVVNVNEDVNAALSLASFESKQTLPSVAGSIAVSPVPLPAAGWMLLAGIGGIVALRRRAKV